MSNDQKALLQFLQERLATFKRKNPRFSIRSFSNKIGISSGPLSEMLNGHRKITKSTAEKIASGLNLDPSERQELFKYFPKAIEENNHTDRNEYLVESKKLSQEQFEVISSWLHYGILSLMKSQTFSSDPHWIAERFAVKALEVETALKRMNEMGLIRKNAQGEWERTVKNLTTTEDVLSKALQKSHLDDFETAKKKLLSVDVKRRDFTSYTFLASSSNIQKAKDIIRRAQDELEQVMLDENSSEVYRVCMHLFPLTE